MSSPYHDRRCTEFTLVFAAMLAATLLASPAFGGSESTSSPSTSASTARSFFSCQRNFADFSEFAKSEQSFDFYHGIALLGGTAGISLGGSPTRQWSGTNDFDTGVRDGLRLGSPSARQECHNFNTRHARYSLSYRWVSAIPGITTASKLGTCSRMPLSRLA